jgi:hypothetical protein
MDSAGRTFWRGPWAIAFYLVGGLAALFMLAVRDCRVADERRRAAQVPPPVPSSQAGTPLEFGRASLVADSGVMRVDLIRRGSGFELSSGGSYGEIRNILFLDPGADKGRWLLPDADHVIAESLEIEREEAPNRKQLLAVAVLVKPAGTDENLVDGRLLVFDPAGRVVESLSDGVRSLHVAAPGAGAEFIVMHERQRKFVVTSLDPITLKARSERVLEVPALGQAGGPPMR